MLDNLESLSLEDLLSYKLKIGAEVKRRKSKLLNQM